MNLWHDLEQMAAILNFLPTMQCLKYYLTRPLSTAYPRTPWIRICLYYVENDMNLLLYLEQMDAISNFLPTMQWLKYFLTTPLCTAYLKTAWWTQTTRICLYYVENDMNLLLDLGQMAAILDFIHNAMSKVIADHTTRSGILKNPIVNTKIMKLHLFCRKLCQFKFWPSPNGGHIEFVQFLRSLIDILLISGRYAL